MLSELSPTDVAFIMAGLTQAVPAVLWWVGGRLIGNSQRATAYWSAFCGASVLSFVFLVWAMRAQDGGSALMLRAVGNIFNVLAVMVLQRGIWAFIGRPATHVGHVIIVGIMLAASWIGLDPAWGSVRVFVLSGLQLAMAFGIVGDLYRHGRDTLHLRRPWLLTDRHGHVVGDSALKHLAGMMSSHVRAVDRVGRFGGEEFVVLMPGLDLKAALSVAERMRERVAASPLLAPEGLVPLSVSIGIAQWNGPYEDVSRLLIRADAALYEAKQGGRDRVASAVNDPVSA